MQGDLRLSLLSVKYSGKTSAAKELTKVNKQEVTKAEDQQELEFIYQITALS